MLKIPRKVCFFTFFYDFNIDMCWNNDKTPIIISEQNKRKSLYPAKFKLFTNMTNKHLVVDDCEINRYFLKKYLERIDIVVDEASNGNTCLVKSQDINYDIIWLDIRMLPLNGFDIAKQLRKNNFENYIIGITANVDSTIVNQCLEAGMNQVIPKPINKEQLYSLLYNLLDLSI